MKEHRIIVARCSHCGDLRGVWVKEGGIVIDADAHAILAATESYRETEQAILARIDRKLREGPE